MKYITEVSTSLIHDSVLGTLKIDSFHLQDSQNILQEPAEGKKHKKQ